MKTTPETGQKELPNTKGNNRDEKGRFIKGVAPNPNGRPKGVGLNLTSLLKQHLETKPKGKKEYYKDLFIRTLLHKALIEKDLQALKLIINYVDGLPQAKIDLTTDGEKITGFNFIKNETNDKANNKTGTSVGSIKE